MVSSHILEGSRAPLAQHRRSGADFFAIIDLSGGERYLKSISFLYQRSSCPHLLRASSTAAKEDGLVKHRHDESLERGLLKLDRWKVNAGQIMKDWNH